MPATKLDQITRIAIYYPAAIGDTLMATPLARALKETLPQVRVTLVTHASLIPLIKLCPFIDEAIGASGKALGDRLLMRREQPDLIINLTRSLRGFIASALNAPVVLQYRKQPPRARPIVHTVDDMLRTLAPIGVVPPAAPYPTIDVERVDPPADLSSIHTPLVVLVPGVGAFRPHRGWPRENWTELLRRLSGHAEVTPVLVGGTAEAELCRTISEDAAGTCLNFAGRLSLVETAVVLSRASAVVAGDTGPMHLAKAVGTPVLGLHGPTYAQRTGPYGASHVLSATGQCSCLSARFCRFKQGPGRCMDAISVENVYTSLFRLLAEVEAYSRQ